MAGASYNEGMNLRVDHHLRFADGEHADFGAYE